VVFLLTAGPLFDKTVSNVLFSRKLVVFSNIVLGNIVLSATFFRANSLYIRSASEDISACARLVKLRLAVEGALLAVGDLTEKSNNFELESLDVKPLKSLM
jgi:hypothetical protein